jgi:hypothetical protein
VQQEAKREIELQGDGQPAHSATEAFKRIFQLLTPERQRFDE